MREVVVDDRHQGSDRGGGLRPQVFQCSEGVDRPGPHPGLPFDGPSWSRLGLGEREQRRGELLASELRVGDADPGVPVKS